MTWFAPELAPLLAVVAATLAEDGTLVEANAGFLRLLDAKAGQRFIGTQVASFFIQPSFLSLVAAHVTTDGDVYCGLVTIGDCEGRVQSLVARVWHDHGRLRVLAEHDIKELGRLCETVLDLNRDYARGQVDLTQANLKLQYLYSKALVDEKRLKDAQRIGKLGFIDWDLLTGEIELSEEALRIDGLAQGKPRCRVGDITKSVHPDDLDLVRQGLRSALESGATLDIEYRIVRPGGETSHVHTRAEVTRDADAKPVRMLGTTQDVSAIKMAQAALQRINNQLEEIVTARTADLVGAKKQAEAANYYLTRANEAAEASHHASEERIRVETEAKMRSRKLEALGTLAAGIAHDFNNILGSIVGFAEMTADELPNDSLGKRNVAQILNASFRARDLVARLLAFARQSPGKPEVVNIVAQVRDALTLLRASLRPSIRLSFENGMDEASATVIADPTQILQIVMNLCVNADDAMDNHGVIRIFLDPAERVEGTMPGRPEGICLTVADSGCGMTYEVLKRKFDPFFTTKKPGKGSGLGLSVVYGIVTELNGLIEVESRTSGSNPGTEFRVFLPLAKNSPHTGEMHGAHIVD